MIGLKIGVVSLEDHDPRWIEEAEEAMAQLVNMLGETVIDARHIGSTAMPSIKAKPIVDIALKVGDFKAVRAKMETLAASGWTHRPHSELANTMYFIKMTDDGESVTHHLFMFEPDAWEWDAHVGFLEHMLKHPRDAMAYEALKVSLAEKYPFDRERYTASKKAFINGIVAKVMKRHRP